MDPDNAKERKEKKENLRKLYSHLYLYVLPPQNKGGGGGVPTRRADRGMGGQYFGRREK
jgi:hypothetical protein